jgi:dihydrolipoamide dehydrogenase
MKQFDLIVIGAGPGGYQAAIRAAQLGLKTALVEKNHLGGTCLNLGCIPTKALLYATKLLAETGYWPDLGLSLEKTGFDYAAMHRRKDAVVCRLQEGVAALLNGNGVEVINGQAVIIAPQTLRVGEDEYRARHILIAAGTRPIRLAIPGMDLPDVVTSDDMLSCPKFYQRLVIIGGGVIGTEFACLYRRLGCEITVIELTDRLLPTLDREISQNLTMIIKKRGMAVYTSARVMGVEKGENGLICYFETKGETQQIGCDGVLMVVGRKGCAEELIGADVPIIQEGGQIIVDGAFSTSVPGIFAVGDIVKGNMQLAHVASAQGINVACAIAGVDPCFDLSVIPKCIFTEPEIATVGLNTDEAKIQGIRARTGKYLMIGNGKSLIEMADRGFIKLVCEEESGRILGAQLMCHHATDMVNELSLAIAKGLAAKDIASLIHPHPTFGEGVLEAAEDIFGTSIHTMPHRK